MIELETRQLALDDSGDMSEDSWLVADDKLADVIAFVIATWLADPSASELRFALAVSA